MKEFAKDTRAVLAYFWSLVTAFLLGYILVKYGAEKEILTLIIGLIGGTILGGIFGVYFSANHSKNAGQASTTEVSTTLTETKQQS